jgi:HAD superfamily hydrolase (TIGR01509 family)
MRFDAILFDCDGVLVDSEILGLDDCAVYLRGHGLNWSPADLIRLFTGLRDDVFAARLLAAYRSVNAAEPPADLFEGLVEERRKRRDELKPVDGAADALQRIDARKAVASSSRAALLEGKLKRTGLWEHVAPHAYSGDLVAEGKPAPDIFLYAAAKLDADPARCLVVEDSVNGVIAGRAAGMTVVGFLGGGHCFDGHGARLLAAGADWTAPDFAHFLKAIGA